MLKGVLSFIERSRRYVRFDVDALCKIAAKACDAQECVSVKKIAEGVYYGLVLVSRC